MSKIDDLNTAITQLGTDISAEIQAVITALQNSGSSDDTAIQAAIDQLTALDKTVTDETASLAGNPPAPPSS